MAFYKTNSKRHLSSLTEDTTKLPPDPEQPRPLGAPGTYMAFIPLHVSRVRGAVHGGPAVIRWFPSIMPKICKKTTDTCTIEISEE